MSGSEQLRVATAIVRKLNPECGFVLLDKLEQMDTDTLKDFAKWLESEGLQAIATRVSMVMNVQSSLRTVILSPKQPHLLQHRLGQKESFNYGYKNYS